MLGRISRIAIAGLVLWMLWGERVFWPATEALPEGTLLVSSFDELSSLPTGQAIAIEGNVFPAELTATESLWKERFAYRRAISRKSEFGGHEEVVTHLVRPASRLTWTGGEVRLPMDSYRLKSAPEAPGHSVFLTTENNVGFRAGDVALALGRKAANGSVAIDELARGPLDVYAKTLESENTFRAFLGHGLRVIVSLLAFSIAARALRGREPSSEGPAPPVTNP